LCITIAAVQNNEPISRNVAGSRFQLDASEMSFNFAISAHFPAIHENVPYRSTVVLNLDEEIVKSGTSIFTGSPSKRINDCRCRSLIVCVESPLILAARSHGQQGYQEQQR